MIFTRHPGRYLLFVSIAALTVISSCSTKKNTWTRRAYHNTTAHYNVYWNGMDNMRSGVKEFHASVKDNFALVLPVYNFGEKGNTGKMAQNADIALKKATKTIQKHSMVFNHKEYVRWIKDAYFLMGKAYFYKQDYPMARHTFEFVIKTYNESDLKYDAMIWQALASIQLGDFNRAESMLDMVSGKIKDGRAPEKYELPLDLAYANFYILKKSYTEALPFLNSAIAQNPDRRTKTRCYFILAQITQQNGDLAGASKLYQLVIKRNASFDMEFNAKINLAQCYDAATGDRDYIVKKLKKMLKDDKNKDYLDQVYYALASVYLKDKDTTAATGYLAKSVALSRTNNYQKAISSLLLADIYFNHKNYPLAQAYYDSTMQFLPKDYPNYKEIKTKTNILTSLVENLNIIQREDSLQRLAGMPEDLRNQVIDKIIAKLIEEDMKKSQEEQLRQENQLLLSQNPGSPGGMPSGGGWYFYNPSAMSQGFSTFTRKWGRRKQEDNWFLADKSMVAFGNEEKEDTTAKSDTTGTKKGEGKVTNKKDRKYYLKDIPFKPEQLDASNLKLIQAFYNAGFIYIEGLHDYEHSIESFETLQRRFPDNKYNVATDYELCQLYGQLGNKPKSDEYKDLILNRYPETDFAKLLINPAYYKEILEKQKAASHLYEDTYIAFTNEQYYMVINNYDIAKEKFSSDSSLLPRFEYLRALSLGKIEVEDSLVSALQKIVMKYPKSQVKPLAQNILDYLSRRKKSGGGEPGGANPDSLQLLITAQKLYAFNPESLHFYVLIVDNTKTDVDALKIKISDFNSKFHDTENLQVNSLLLDKNLEMVTVSTFDNSDKAFLYFLSINNSKYIFTKLETSGGYSDFVISAENYPIFFRSKNIPQYQKFFETNYQAKK